MKRIFVSVAAAAMAILVASPVVAEETPDIEMWRLDCGKLEVSDMASFSDAHLYDGEQGALVVSCYLIRNGSEYLLWDAGLPSVFAESSVTSGIFTMSVDQTITAQLADLGLSRDDVTYVGISHYHFDHTGQLSDFAGSTLLIGAADWEVVKATETANELLDPRPFAAWLGEDANPSTVITHDNDVFGDGSVQIKAMPGHTPGHTGLLVRLPETGNVLLTGDLYHFEEQVENRGVPAFNASRADTLASFERFNAIAKSLDAKVVIQHDTRHVDRLPNFPESAK